MMISRASLRRATSQLPSSVKLLRPHPQQLRCLSAATKFTSTSTTPTPRPAQIRTFPKRQSNVDVAFRSYATSTGEKLKKTPLYDLHVRNGAKMAGFGGYEMPMQYKDQSHLESHKWVREQCGLFDVSHMVQHQITGPSALAFLESITPSDLKSLPAYSSTLSTFLHDSGGIVDDTVIAKHSDTAFYVVTNAACRDKDIGYITTHLNTWNSSRSASDKVRHSEMKEQGLIALQGPKAKDALESILPNDTKLDELYFGQCRFSRVLEKVSGAARDGNGQALLVVHIARGGYTGEDGFEISVPGDMTESFAQALLDSLGGNVVKLAGLAARDSLRLEAGMCLYGHDLTDETTPIEGALGWIIPKSRRESGGFPGAEKILEQLKNGVKQRRVGFVLQGAPAREGAEVVDKESGEVIGHITSGSPSPTLGAGMNVAMGYIKHGMHKSGTEVGIKVRGKVRDATVKKMPFVETKYYKPAK